LISPIIKVYRGVIQPLPKKPAFDQAWAFLLKVSLAKITPDVNGLLS
jgi:hypothetical protein